MTTVSAVDICNDAMSLFGHDEEITSLDPAVDSSAEAVKCARQLDLARRHVFTRHAWSFLSQSPDAAGLECAAVNPLPGHAAVYAPPADAIKIIGALDSAGEQLSYTLNDGYMHTKAAADVIRYTLDQPEVERWSLDGVLAVTAELAYRLCRVMMPSDGKLVASLRADAAEQLRASKSADNAQSRRETGKGSANPYMQARR